MVQIEKCFGFKLSGFGSCKSVVEIQLTTYDFRNSILCVVDLPNYQNIAVQEFELPSGKSLSLYFFHYSTIFFLLFDHSKESVV